jgi:hypothetical protein
MNRSEAEAPAIDMTGGAQAAPSWALKDRQQ